MFQPAQPAPGIPLHPAPAEEIEIAPVSIQDRLKNMAPEERQKTLEDLRAQFAEDFDAIAAKKSKGAAVLETDLEIGKPFEIKTERKPPFSQKP